MKLKSLFFGTPDFALPSFQKLIELTDCVGLVCQPDRARGRGHKVLPCPTREHAQALALPSFAPASLRKSSDELDALRSFLKSKPVDIFIVLAYGNLLPEEFLNGAKLGCFNIHASLLPRWRGAAPIQRALEAGDTQSGVCIQRMVQKLDAGNVLLSEPCAIENEDSAKELTTKLCVISAELLGKFIVSFSEGTLNSSGKVQDESQVSLAPKITKEESFYGPEWSARETHNRIRAFRVWPQVKFRTSEDQELKLLKSSLVENQELQKRLRPGELLILENKVYLGTKVRPGEFEVLQILEAQAPNKSPQNALQVFNKIASFQNSDTKEN